MAACPVCHNPIVIEDRHKGGLFTCPSCQGTYFIDFGGNAEPPLPKEQLNEAPEEPAQVSSSYGTDYGVSSFESPSYESTPEAPPESNLDNFVQESTPPAVFEEAPVENFADIVEFANQEVEVLNLSYSLEISNINSKIKIKKLLEVLSEPRLQIDTTDITQQLSQVNSTSIFLERLSALQTSVIVNSLKADDMELQWRQLGL